MAEALTLLGFVAADRAASVQAAMDALPGPRLSAHRCGAVAAIAQLADAPRRALLLARDRARLLSGLLAVQRRLEAACQAGPFLPADPGAPALRSGELPDLLGAAAPALIAALAREGRRHQWDVVLRWPADAVLEPRRAALQGLSRALLAEAVHAALAGERAARRAALLAALRPMVLDIAEAEPVAEDTACGATVLVAADGEAAIEAALGALPAAMQHRATADLRGPLPPIAFAAVRVAELAEGEVERAWSALGLPEQIAPEDLPAKWREVASRLHPDRAGPDADPARFAEAQDAYRLLARFAGAGAPLSRRTLARGRRHLLLPEAA